MAGNSTKDIKRHQKSIGNTQKITKAMEMVSAVKMRKSQLSAITSRPYAQHSLRILQELALINQEDQGETSDLKNNIFFNKPTGNTVILVLVAPDKGLVGGLNSNLLTYTQRTATSIRDKNETVKGISIGAKASVIFSKLNIEIIQEFTNQDSITQETINPIAHFIIEAYKDEEIKQVKMVYTEFFSTLKQSPSHKQLLPISIEEIEETIEDIPPTEGKWSDDSSPQQPSITPQDYVFEPDRARIVQDITPFLINIASYNILLEANASEHSARMIAMRNASQNAEKILEELTLSYNKARQRSITQEISEVSSGAEALTL